MKRKVKLTGSQRKEIAIGVLEECINIEWEGDGSFSYVEDFKGAKYKLGANSDYNNLKDIEIEEI